MSVVVTAERRAGRVRGLFVGNVMARLGSLVALAAATVMVARAGGSTLVGAFTLLRVLPALAGVLAAAGLPGAAPFFLAFRSNNPALRPTMVAITGLGATTATACWLALTPALHRVFFSDWGVGVVLAGASAVFTQLFVSVGKALLQGSGDLRGANAAIVAEEAAFLPLYGVLLLVGSGTGALVAALVAADIAVAWGIGERLRRNGFFRGWHRPEYALGREICRYGMRGQLGGLLSLINLRLDVAILGAIAGPAVLGVYAIASKFAELLRMPGLALNYVLYPAFARADAGTARARTRKLLPATAGLNALGAVPLALAAAPLLPLVYGADFRGAVVPAWILLVGLVGEGVSGLIGAYLYGVNRPGLNSIAIGVGVVLTVVGDLLLIPQHGAAGAAVASAIAYLTTAGTLLLLFAVVRPAPIGRKVDEKKAMDRGPGRHRRGGLRDTERDKVG